MGVVPTYVYAIFGLLFLAMIAWVLNRAKQNRRQMLEDNKPPVAGSDSIAGVAHDKGQFDEPNDAALTEMADLLEEAAESQGLEFKE